MIRVVHLKFEKLGKRASTKSGLRSDLKYILLGLSLSKCIVCNLRARGCNAHRALWISLCTTQLFHLPLHTSDDSSEPSLQSGVPSHCFFLGTHCLPSAHFVLASGHTNADIKKF